MHRSSRAGEAPKGPAGPESRSGSTALGRHVMQQRTAHRVGRSERTHQHTRKLPVERRELWPDLRMGEPVTGSGRRVG